MKDQFLKDVAEHKMTIFQDDGVRRHVKFSRPGSNVYRFDLLTWPGRLCYTGDMGTFVFARLNDMFEFFRTPDMHRQDFWITPSYWSEKVLAQDVNGGVHEWDPDRFERVIKEDRREWMRGIKDKLDRQRVFHAVTDEVLSKIPNGEYAAMTAAYEFIAEAGGGDYAFHDLWDRDFRKHTFGFLWACYAIVWGINRYDEAKV